MKKLSFFVFLFITFFLVGCNLAQTTIHTPTPVNTRTSTATFSPTPIPTITPTTTPIPSNTPTATPTLTPSSVPKKLPTSYLIKEGDTLEGISISFGVPLVYIALANEIENTNLIIVGNTLTIPDPTNLPEMLPNTKKILVILSEQKIYAFENNQLMADFLVSTGVAEHPTVTGIFHIYSKLEKTDMSGDGYNLKDVPWTMYFFQGYGFHGTYWHSNFGHPMSHGCINMKTSEAKWLFSWATINTEVKIIQ